MPAGGGVSHSWSVDRRWSSRSAATPSVQAARRCSGGAPANRRGPYGAHTASFYTPAAQAWPRSASAARQSGTGGTSCLPPQARPQTASAGGSKRATVDDVAVRRTSLYSFHTRFCCASRSSCLTASRRRAMTSARPAGRASTTSAPKEYTSASRAAAASMPLAAK